MSGKTRLRAASIRFLSRVVFATLALAVFSPAVSRSQDSPDAKREEAHQQYARAEKLCSDLESSPSSKRTEEDYAKVVEAYRRVYLITPRAPEVIDALDQVGILYRTMGDLFDVKYYQLAVDTFQFLLHDYPENRYREAALLAVGEIEKDDLNNSALARKAFEEYLSSHPRSAGSSEAKQAIAEIASQTRVGANHSAAPSSESNPDSPATAQGQNRGGDGASSSPPSPFSNGDADVTRIRTWNADTYTRIVIDVGSPVTYRAARISGPDRIYFDLEHAHLDSSLLHSPIEIEQGGYLKGLRVGQNQSGVVRIVLDVTQVKDYSVFLLKNPSRLVVDVYGPSGSEAKSAPPDVEPPASNSQSTSQQPHQTTVARANTPQPKSQSASGPGGPSDLPSTGSRSSPPLQMPEPEARQHQVTSQLKPPSVPSLPRDGQPSLTRALGLKVGRIVIDAGHGGHDTGTIGPTGLMEKDLCLDVALRLGKLIQQRLPGAEVIYTRDDDTFVPLEQRTEIANEAKADLFISIHANSSPDDTARGVETYYLNFTNSPDSMEVAARENATSDLGEHDLQDVLQKIARNDKIEESRDLAADVQDSLSKRMARINKSEKDRGVRRAPFVVLIGATMPSILSEIAFISNPADEQMLKKPDTRQRVAEGLYQGIATYLQSTNSLTYNEPHPVDGDDRVARNGNPR